jgi:hypothetical protein
MKVGFSNPYGKNIKQKESIALRLVMVFLWLPCLAIAGCLDRGNPSLTAPANAEVMFGSSVTPMDHDPSDTFVRKVYVDGHWVGSAGTGGSIVADGITLPHKWHPGLTAKVGWERCEPYGKNCQWQEKIVPIHQYDEVGRTWLHIMSGNEVLIIPSMLAPNHPDYPGPGYPEKNFFAEKTP